MENKFKKKYRCKNKFKYLRNKSILIKYKDKDDENNSTDLDIDTDTIDNINIQSTKKLYYLDIIYSVIILSSLCFIYNKTIGLCAVEPKV